MNKVWGRSEVLQWNKKYVIPLRTCPQVHGTERAEREWRAVSVGVLCVEQQKPILANSHEKEFFWKDTRHRRIEEESRFKTDRPRYLQKILGAGITKLSCLDFPTGKDELSQPFSVFSSLNSRRNTAVSLAGIACPAIGQRKGDYHDSNLI